MKISLGIIGFGNMGSAIAQRLKTDYAIHIFDKDTARIKQASGFQPEAGIPELVKNVEVVIFAVKPQDMEAVLKGAKPAAKEQLFITIAAGIPTQFIEKVLGNIRLIRVMPNMPAKIGLGMNCLCKGRFAGDEDLSLAEKLFSRMGKTLIINENMMDASTAVSGSGPAYVCANIESGKGTEIFLNDFQDAARSLGFNQEEAVILVHTTFTGTMEYLRQTKLPARELIKQVSSKGGTTEAALAVLSKGGSLKEAVRAAAIRAAELAKRS